MKLEVSYAVINYFRDILKIQVPGVPKKIYEHDMIKEWDEQIEAKLGHHKDKIREAIKQRKYWPYIQSIRSEIENGIVKFSNGMYAYNSLVSRTYQHPHLMELNRQSTKPCDRDHYPAHAAK